MDEALGLSSGYKPKASDLSDSFKRHPGNLKNNGTSEFLEVENFNSQKVTPVGSKRKKLLQETTN